MIDSKLMQKLQDYFCEANGLYLACIDKENGVVTKAYGLVESKDFLYQLIDQDTYYSLVKKMKSSDIETVIEEKLNVDYIKCVEFLSELKTLIRLCGSLSVL